MCHVYSYCLLWAQLFHVKAKGFLSQIVVTCLQSREGVVTWGVFSGVKVHNAADKCNV